jgi:hypothetical protein
MYSKSRQVFVPQFISLLFIDLFFLIGYWSANVIVTSDALTIYAAAVASINAIVIASIVLKNDAMVFYVTSYLSLYVLGLIFITRDVFVLAFTLPYLFLSLYSIYSIKISGKLTRYISFISVVLFMLYIGKVFLLTIQPSPALITFQNLQDKISIIGLPIPITESFGLYVSTRFADIFLSPLQFYLQFVVAALLVENYHKIFGLLFHTYGSGKRPGKSNSGLISAGYAIVATFSCQCESAIALLPSLTILVVSLLELPFFIMSVSFLLLTFLLITKFYSAGKLPVLFRRRNIHVSFRYAVFIPIIIATQFLVIVGVAFTLESSPFFLFGIGMSMLLDGFLLFYLVEPFVSMHRLRKSISIVLTSLSILLALIWFIPSITSLSIHSALYFEAMSYSMTLSGLIIGTVYFNSLDSYGINLTEIFVVAVGLVPLVIYYYTFFLADKIWKFWSLSQQIELALVLWLVMLPVMWIATQRSLADPVILLSPSP